MNSESKRNRKHPRCPNCDYELKHVARYKPCVYCKKDYYHNKNFNPSKFCSQECAHASRKFTKEERLESLRKRFESKFIKGNRYECWEWQAYRNKAGYGVIGSVDHRGHSMLAHRVSYLLQWGNLEEGLFVMHTCDNPPCVNPEHLKLGTNQDNIDDMVSKGRNHYKPGPNIYRSKINIEIARNIKIDLINKISSADIAKKYNITKHIVDGIRQNKTWKHISIEE